MIRTVILDDERLAISKLRHVLSGFEDIDIVAAYENPVIAIPEIGRLLPDLLLLDINMPEWNGLHVAEQAAELAPDMHIVFVTAHSEYALEAFEMAALDYLVKPATKERMHKVVQRVRKRMGIGKQIRHSARARIATFGRLEVLRPGAEGAGQQPVFRSAKVKELFCYMLAWNGKKLGKTSLMDALWPDMDHKRALGNLNTCMYQLRKNLADSGLDVRIAYTGDSYAMHVGDVFVDLHPTFRQ